MIPFGDDTFGVLKPGNWNFPCSRTYDPGLSRKNPAPILE
jgi:hypothetical protein